MEVSRSSGLLAAVIRYTMGRVSIGSRSDHSVLRDFVRSGDMAPFQDVVSSCTVEENDQRLTGISMTGIP